ncbi:antirepressor, BRO family protein [Campylobacter jejuni]|uniref:BRO-N domain-containing protein n=1 Tax=Campylobacter jejuni TaxID=197 RepID=UPI00069BF958|nr:BRO family protein [Campylobacter jejuni]EAH7541567.1 antirepressor, BRO family protein [Campylobacter jejuni]EAI2115229.1 antirepressor, BRO family protein [Campylobacter jejuni]EAI3208870.1 antirepressor, BRO family protein [Campylobacter jejuni]EAJ1132379.1 antirepressor, BRO family protein [Campylobacter jejuni]EAJ2426269.1 antirepressor, BRO family protein [Campylobacter jejuni]
MNLELFKKDDLEIRVIKDENNEPLFCLSDVCKALELTNPSMVKDAILKEFELSKLNLGSFDTGFGVKEFTMIDEAQLYYVMNNSRSKNAKPFRMWVNKEVLPSIRKNGNYMQKEFSKELYSLLNDLKQANCIKDKLKNENESLKDELIQNQRELLSFYKNKDLKKEKLFKLSSQIIDQIKSLKTSGKSVAFISDFLNVSQSSVRKYSKDFE